jgi:hypothetical protein
MVIVVVRILVAGVLHMGDGAKLQMKAIGGRVKAQVRPQQLDMIGRRSPQWLSIRSRKRHQ